MLITSFSNLDALNNYFDTICANSSCIQLDSHIDYIIRTNDIQVLRDYLLEDAALEDLHNYASIKAATKLDTITEYISDYPVYVFPNSTTKFKREIFTNLLPSLSTTLYQHLKISGRISQLGSGSGQAVFIKYIPFTQPEYETFSFYLNPHLIKEAVSNMISSQSDDISYLLQIVANLQTDIQNLTSTNDSLVVDNMNIRMMTWA